MLRELLSRLQIVNAIAVRTELWEVFSRIKRLIFNWRSLSAIRYPSYQRCDRPSLQGQLNHVLEVSCTITQLLSGAFDLADATSMFSRAAIHTVHSL